MTGVESGMRHGLRSLGMKNRQKGENKKSSYFIRWYQCDQIWRKITTSAKLIMSFNNF